MFKIEYIGSNSIENQPFEINRPEGSYRYIFFHFLSKVVMNINGQIIEANPGSCILYEPNVPQHFYVENNRLNHDFLDFIIDDPSFFEKIKFPLNTLMFPKMSDDINKSIKEMYDENKEGSLGYEQMLDAKASELFIKIARKITPFSESRKQYDESLKSDFENVRIKMYENPDNLDISSLANELGFSLSHFNYLYKQFFKITPIKDLTRARVARVDEMVKQNIPTKTIIKTIGFASEEYFYRWFKKEFKMTKNEYENKIKKQ